MAVVALAAAIVALGVWVYAGAAARGHATRPTADPLAGLRFGGFGDLPEAVRVLHWTYGKRATKLTKIAEIDVPTRPEALALLPDGLLLVCSASARVVAIVDVRGLRVVSEIPVGGAPVACALTRDGASAWVALEDAAKVVVLDTGARKLVAEVPCGRRPVSVAAASDGSIVLVANRASKDVTAIRAWDASASGTVTVGAEPRGIAVAPLTPSVYLALAGRELARLDWNALRVRDRAVVGSLGGALVASPDGERLYAALAYPRGVAKIGAGDMDVHGTCELKGGVPRALLVGPNGRDLFAAGGGRGYVTVVDTWTMSPGVTVEADAEPSALALSPDARRLYVAHRATSVVYIYEIGYEQAR